MPNASSCRCQTTTAAETGEMLTNQFIEPILQIFEFEFEKSIL